MDTQQRPARPCAAANLILSLLVIGTGTTACGPVPAADAPDRASQSPGSTPATATHSPASPSSPAPTFTPPPVREQPLDEVETRIIGHIDSNAAQAEALLRQIVDINSGTMNRDGVRKVGAVFAPRLEALGFQTRWIDMSAVGRAGHLFAELTVAPGQTPRGKRVLLIGHLDTVFEPDSPFQGFERLGDGRARGPGVVDMKSGDVVILSALEALHSVGALEGSQIIVALLGDEEHTGDPVLLSRKDLIDAARRSDVALGFEEGVGGSNTATIARRGYTGWTLTVEGQRGHSSGVFSERLGSGAAYELARILSAFHDQPREAYLTYNAGLIMAGTRVEHDSQNHEGQIFGKSNVVPQRATATGEMRALTVEQRERAKQRMKAIVARSLPKTRSRITFRDGIPPMAPTEGNLALFSELDAAGRALGLAPLTMIDPGRRGAADISFAAPHVGASLAGLGAVGSGSHSTEEIVDLATLPMVTRRAAVLVYRLTR